jgi:ribosomal protein RSM22 (predicted rRNA methylase)
MFRHLLSVKIIRSFTSSAITAKQVFTPSKFTALSVPSLSTLDHPDLREDFLIDDNEDDETDIPPEDPILAESNIGWRDGPIVPPQLIDNIRELAKEHNIKRVNEKFSSLEEHRLEFSLQELSATSWFKATDDNDNSNSTDNGEDTIDSSVTSKKHFSKKKASMKKYKSIEYGPEESLAYTIRRSVPVYTTLSRVFAEVQRRSPGFKPSSLLDFGSGPGTSVWSTDTVWPNHLGFNAGSFTFIEHSKSMEELSDSLLVTEKELAQKHYTRYYGPNLKWRTSLRDLLTDHQDFGDQERSSSSSTTLKEHHFHDVVLASNMIAELKSDAIRDAAIQLLWQLVAPGGMLVVVERGNRWGSYVTNRVRQLVLNIDPDYSMVIAPCTHSKACPMIQGLAKEKTWCHFAHRTGDEEIRLMVGNRSPQHRPSYDQFSYIVLQKKKKISSKRFDDHIKWNRIIKPPLRRGKHVIMDVCHHSGKLKRTIYGKRKHKEGGVYRAAKKSEWGAMWGKD